MCRGPGGHGRLGGYIIKEYHQRWRYHRALAYTVDTVTLFKLLKLLYIAKNIGMYAYIYCSNKGTFGSYFGAII